MPQPQTKIFIPASEDISLHTIISTPQNPSLLPTLILIHFWGGSNQTFLNLITQLDQKHAVIAPSLRGWGHSSKPKDPSAYRTIDHANDIISVVQHIQASRPELTSNGILLVGHSMGGKVAQYLTTRPEITSVLKGVVLLAPAPAGRFALPEEMREQQMHAYDDVQTARFVIENVLLGGPGNVDGDVLMGLAADAASGSEGARRAWPSHGMAEDYEKSVIDGVQRHELAGFRLRVLIIVGALDRIETPMNVKTRVAKTLADAGADVQVEILGGVGHLTPVEAPGKVAALIMTFADSL